ncbi:hypothetical protein E2C01_026217 [Portunus trituberculatus]|uniref:Uncharacterized protein n=1 Tax=Portunus trituberculatus TaxID=210409 RepID=A0A5B7EK46_PORTR|nr:hypothetical protein [Portunus trituberculatus]
MMVMMVMMRMERFINNKSQNTITLLMKFHAHAAIIGWTNKGDNGAHHAPLRSALIVPTLQKFTLPRVVARQSSGKANSPARRSNSVFEISV